MMAVVAVVTALAVPPEDRWLIGPSIALVVIACAGLFFAEMRERKEKKPDSKRDESKSVAATSVINPNEWPPLNDAQVENWIRELRPFGLRALTVCTRASVEIKKFFWSIQKVGRGLNFEAELVTIYPTRIGEFRIQATVNDPAAGKLAELCADFGVDVQMDYQPFPESKRGDLTIFIGEKKISDAVPNIAGEWISPQGGIVTITQKGITAEGNYPFETMNHASKGTYSSLTKRFNMITVRIDGALPIDARMSEYHETWRLLDENTLEFDCAKNGVGRPDRGILKRRPPLQHL